MTQEEVRRKARAQAGTTSVRPNFSTEIQKVSGKFGLFLRELCCPLKIGLGEGEVERRSQFWNDVNNPRCLCSLW